MREIERVIEKEKEIESAGLRDTCLIGDTSLVTSLSHLSCFCFCYTFIFIYDVNTTNVNKAVRIL